MTLDTLREDLKQNLSEVATLATTISATPETSSKIDILVAHLQNTLWPTIESVVEEMNEIDECMADMIENAEDILQPDTARVFAAVLTGAAAVTAALKARITREAEPQLFRVAEELEKNVAQATAIMKEIVIDDGEPLDDEDEDEDDEDEDDEDDDDEEDNNDH